MHALRFTVLALALASIACSDAGGEGGGAVCMPKSSLTGLPGLPSTPGATSASDITSVPSFGDNPGGLAMYVFAPSTLAPGAPVVVALHGCTQTAAAYAAAGWNELAQRQGFVVVYAEQSASNDAQRCFRWWDPAHVTRERGEAKSIKSMVDFARAKYRVGDAFVTGLSAGGAMTAVMLATYPDVFRAGAIMSGLPYGCAKSKNEAYSCMSGKEQSAAAWGALVPSVAAANAPRVSIWHGDADWIVRPANAEALVRQWTSVNHAATASGGEKVGGAMHTVYRDAKGVARVEEWIVSGMGHGVALDPKHACGTAGAFLLDESLCSTSKAAEFFGIAGGGASNKPGATNAAANPCD